MNGPYYINGTSFPDTATAAAYFDEAYDMDSYADMSPNGLSEALAWLRFNHPELSDTDINTLAAAVHAHATRPDQDVPLRASLQALVRGVPIYRERTPPEWLDPTDHLANLPPALHRRTQAPVGLITRMARKLALR